MNGVTPATDRFGNSNSAYRFDGIDDYLITPANNILDNDQTGAISVWIKPFSTTGNKKIFMYSTDESRNSLYNFKLQDDSLEIVYKYGISDVPYIHCPKEILENQWYHLVFLADGTEKIKFYINGNKQEKVFGPYGSSANGSEWFADIKDVNTFNHFIIIGAERRHGTLHGSEFNGIIDDIRIYNYAITETEILDLYEEGGWSGDDPYKDMIYIPAGEFTMGSNSGEPDEQPVHTVYLDAYYIDKYEVTNHNYAKYLNEALSSGEIVADSNTVTKNNNELIDLDNTGCQIYYFHNTFYVESGKENNPVIFVTWYGAEAYAKHYGKRLPTEAEWEKAARGTDQRAFPWGNDLPTDQHCNFNNNVGHTTPVGQYSPNGDSPFGCCDMSGNVSELCNDYYDANYYSNSPYKNPQGPLSGGNRVLRGGSWAGGPWRCADRSQLQPRVSRHGVGFRCVWVDSMESGLWSSNLSITGNGVNLNRSFGGDTDGSNSFDNGLDQVAPPLGQNYYAYFSIPEFPDYLATDIRHWEQPFEEDIDWTLRIVNAEGINTTITWNPDLLPPIGTFFLEGASSYNMRSVDSISVSGNKTLTIKYRKELCFSFDFPQTGWYLISLPLIPADSSVANLFPDALGGTAYIWDPVTKSYLSETQIQRYQAYWIAIPSPTTVQICGQPIDSYTQHLQAQGWYMIGSVMGNTDFTNPDDNPDGSVLTPAYGWNHVTKTYLPADTLHEKNGYWAAVFEECDLTVSNTGPVAGSTDLPKTNWMEFVNSHGSSPPGPPDVNWDSGQIKETPSEYQLFQNYPNPFNSETVITFHLPQNEFVKIEIYNISGQRLTTLARSHYDAGVHKLGWNGTDESGNQVSSGIYFYKLKTDDFVSIKKMLFIQ